VSDAKSPIDINAHEAPAPDSTDLVLPTAIPALILEMWQGIVDTMAKLIDVPAGLIMRITGDEIEVLVSSRTEGNPYHPGDAEHLAGSGLYCETVIDRKDQLLVPNALADLQWRNNPDIRLNMVSYLGFPILWPDARPFGTICVLDRKDNAYSEDYQRLIRQFRDIIEHHLTVIHADWQRQVSVARDRRREKEALRLSEERFRVLAEHAADDIFLHDAEGRILDVNKRACQNTGRTHDALLQMSFGDLSFDFETAWNREIWAEVQPGYTTTVQAKYRHGDGTVFPVEIQLTCQSVQGEKLFLALVRDITERVKAAEAIGRLNVELEQRVVQRTQEWRQSVDLLLAVMDGATDAIFVKDLEGRFLLFNRAAGEFAAQPPENVIGKTAADLFGEKTGAQIRAHEVEVMRRGEVATVEETITAGGITRLCLATRSPYRDQDGNLIGLIGISRDITSRRQAEQALGESEARWQFAVDGAGDGLWDWNVETGHVFYSRQWKEMLGYDEADIGDRLDDWSDRVHPEDLPRIQDVIDEHLQGRPPDFSFTYRIRAKDGSWKWLLSRGKAVKWTEDGQPLRVIGTHTDVTARKLTRDELSTQRERLMLATEASRLGVWDYDLDANTILCDARWHEIFDIDPDSSSVNTIETFNNCVHPEDVDRVTHERLTALAAGQKLHHINFRIVTPSGEIRWIASSACLIERTDVTAPRLVGIVKDVTESRLAEQKLQQSYESLRQAERLAKIGSWTLDPVTRQFSYSDMMWEMKGEDPNGPPITVADLQKMFSPEDYRKVRAGVTRCMETGEPYDIEVEHLRPDGSSFAAHVRGQANRDASGTITSLTGTIQDITEREEARARLAALADNLPSGAIYRLEPDTDGLYVLTYISAGILSLLGVPAAELLADRHAFVRAIHEDDLAGYKAAVKSALASRDIFDRQFRVGTRDGRIIWVHCRAAARSQSDGSTVWDGIMRDVTAERQVAETLRQAKEAAERAERAKSDFLAIMSHEIRTPMNTVLGMTRLALQTELAPKQRNYLDKINASAQALIAIISDVLDFSKIEAGMLELEEAEYTLESVLESVSAVTAIRAEEKGLEIVWAVAQDMPNRLLGDSLRLGQVLINLVSNAIKFTHEGEVVVSIAPGSKAGADAIMLDFAVQDTGIGLNPDQIAGLFQSFTQADTYVSRKYGGTGLGLAICKQLVERMGGRIWVSSEPGRGSTFYFTIEAKRPTGSISRGVAQRSPGLKGRRVLVVDDNASARNILAAMVRGFGMDTELVASGEEALTALKRANRERRDFDLVLMDWRMPGMDGLETAQQIKADAELHRTPAVLMITAYGREEILRRAEQLDLHGVLIKPVTESVMFNTVTDIFDRVERPANRHLVPHRGTAPADPAHNPVAREKWLEALAGRRILVVDDNALNREVVSDFLLVVGMKVDTAVNGLDALAHLDQGTYDAVLMDMHMPEMDGLTAVQEIRRRPHWSGLPIIALTAQARVEDRKASLAAGMNAHLTKPIDEMALYRTLSQLFSAATVDAAVAGPAVLPPLAASPGFNSFDLAAALKRLGGQEERLHRLLRGFLRDFSATPAKLAEALEAGNAEEVTALAHTAKGAASYLDAREFCDIAGRLEEVARKTDLDAMRQYVPLFNSRLHDLLAQVAAVLDRVERDKAKGSQIDTRLLLDLIAQAEPLVFRGDYAAQALLHDIATRLTGTTAAPLAETACMSYDDLELEAAGTALRQLRVALEQAMPGDSHS
jgi:two-component system sensor histidine kinase/response regulator